METPQAATTAEIAEAVQQGQQASMDALAEQLLNVAQLLRAEVVKIAPTTKMVCSRHTTNPGEVVQFLSKSDTRKRAVIIADTGFAILSSDSGGVDKMEVVSVTPVIVTSSGPLWLVEGAVSIIEEHG